jgi:hypothetical protein
MEQVHELLKRDPSSGKGLAISVLADDKQACIKVHQAEKTHKRLLNLDAGLAGEYNKKCQSLFPHSLYF